MTTASLVSAGASGRGAQPIELSFEEFVARVRRGFDQKALAPYVGPLVASLTTGDAMPLSYAGLAEYLGSKVALPRRAKGNPWAAAQYIESTRHRASLVALLREAFQGQREPLPFHHAILRWELPLVVDTWYDGTLGQVLGRSASFAELQGTDRTGVTTPVWFTAYDGAGAEISLEEAKTRTTLLYTPHGAIRPAGRFLLSDADYVEVLTEIDIQSPIPEPVKQRRAELGFVFLGCRFHDQLLRTFARQIAKRSAGPHYAAFERDDLTKMERKFAAELGLKLVFAPLPRVLEALA